MMRWADRVLVDFAGGLGPECGPLLDHVIGRSIKRLALPIHNDVGFGAYAAFGTSGRTGSFGFFTA